MEMRQLKMAGASSSYDDVDEALDESFPCSDPPAWTCGRSPDRSWLSGRHAAKPPREIEPLSVLIYQPAPGPLQGGRALEERWLLEFVPRFAPTIDHLMGWNGSRDVQQQVRLRFKTRESAIAFAKREGWRPVVLEPRKRRIRPKSYVAKLRPPLLNLPQRHPSK